MPRLSPHTFYADIPLSGTPPGSTLYVYVADTGRPHCLYHNGIQNGALPAFPLVLGTTKCHNFEKTAFFFNISVITENIYLKL